jgi:hypothetical protein
MYMAVSVPCGFLKTGFPKMNMSIYRIKPLLFSNKYVSTQVQSSRFMVQWLFAEPLTVKCGFFISRLRSLGMDNGFPIKSGLNL